MPPRVAPLVFREIRVLDPDHVGPKPEAIAAVTPFCLVASTGRSNPHWALSTTSPSVPVDHSRPDFLGWMRIFIGVKSSSAQRRTGLWLHREDWVWGDAVVPMPPEEHKVVYGGKSGGGPFSENAPATVAKRTMAAESGRGHYVVAVLELWLPVQRPDSHERPNSLLVGPPEMSALRDFYWLVGQSDLATEITFDKGRAQYAHVRRYTRSKIRDGADGRGWGLVLL